MLVLKSIAEEERKYGTHFAQENTSIQMPKIWWNAQVVSCRKLKDLEKIHFLNYKNVYNDDVEGNEENDNNGEETEKFVKV